MKDGLPCGWVLRPGGDAFEQNRVRSPVCSACVSAHDGRPHEQVLREDCEASERAIEGLRRLVAESSVAVAPDDRAVEEDGRSAGPSRFGS